MSPLAAKPDWMERARCRGVEPDLFFPGLGKGEELAEAKAFCEPCSVKDECLAFSIEHNYMVGIYGGESAKERKRMRAEMLKTKLKTKPKQDMSIWLSIEEVSALLNISTSHVYRLEKLHPRFPNRTTQLSNSRLKSFWNRQQIVDWMTLLGIWDSVVEARTGRLNVAKQSDCPCCEQAS